MGKNEKKPDKYQLPLREIKHDVFKTGLFALLSLVILLIMYFSQIGPDDLLGLFR